VESTQSDLTSKERGNLLEWLLAAGLVLFLVLLPFHLVIKKLVPDPVGTYWKEGLLGLLVILWGLRAIQHRRLRLTETPLDRAVLAYLALLFLRALLDRAGLATAWGLYISILYLPLVWLLPAVLRHSPGWLVKLAWIMTGVGAVIALGGLVEFVLDQALWPSAEMVQRQGFADVYVYGTHLRRVYFVFDSPTTLANTLAMLLPLAISLILAPGKLWARVMAGIAAVLMAMCIVVTFSRGIWVAAVLGLVFMAVQTGFVRRNRRPLAIALGVLALAVVAWGFIMAPRMVQSNQNEQGIRELTAQKYREAQGQLVMDLEQVEPAAGKLELQTWDLSDPIEKIPDQRSVIYQHPPDSGKTEIIYSLNVPENGVLKFGIALSPEVWDPEKGDGASFELFVNTPDGPAEGQIIFNRYINPKINPSDRRWRNYVVNLAPWAGKAIKLSLVTQSGPSGNWAYDWAGWSDMQLVQMDPAIFAQAGAGSDNLLIRVLGSITNWTEDETNRDRIAAWNLSLSTWRRNPIWGSGLGSTGVAALRANPEQAFVTESQVLKALTELGIPGLLVLAYIWFEIIRCGIRAYRQEMPLPQRAILVGICTGLVVVFIESLVYQNLEVKQVNAYFWTLAGMLAFLSRARDD